MKVALFKNLSYDSVGVQSQPEWVTDPAEREAWCMNGYVRISEWVDVEFPHLNTEEVIQAQLRQIDEAERIARERFNEQLERFKGMRANLIALPAPAQAA